MAEGVLAQLKVLLSADISRLKSGLNEAQLASDKSSRKIEGNFHRLGTVFERLIGPLSATGREISVAMDAIGASAAEANKSLTSMGSALAVTASVGTAAFAALAGVTVKLFDGLEQTAHAAAGVGMGVAQYTELTSALKIFDINQEQANQALAYFDKILSGLVRSKAGAEAIKELGLNMAQLRTMTPHDALLAIADAFSKLKDGTMKAGIAAALFENTYGIKLIPFLDQGKSGILQLESRFTGLANATQANALAAENLTAQWENFKAILEGLTLRLANFFHIPELLENVAHPILTLKEYMLGLGISATWVFEEINKGALDVVSTLNRVSGALHLPKIGLSEFTANISQLEAIRQKGLDELAATLHEIQTGGMEQHTGGGNVKPPKGGNGGRGVGNRAAAYLAQLREQLAEIGKGDAARGIEHLKELGATQAQLAQGSRLLNAIQTLKDERAFAEGFEKTQKSMGHVLEKLKLPTATVNNLSDSFAELTRNIQMAGAAALGIKQTVSQSMIGQGASIAMGGGPIGGAVPVFKPSGIGSMRIDMDKLNLSAKAFGKTMSQSFTRMLETGQGFHQMLNDLIREFEAFAIKASLFKMLGNSLGSKGGFLGVIGSFFGGLSAPGRASGGPVGAGSLYKVGEHGTELFAPAVSGQIIPANKMQEGGSSLVYSPTFHINTPDADSFRKSQSQIASEAYRKMAMLHARNA